MDNFDPKTLRNMTDEQLGELITKLQSQIQMIANEYVRRGRGGDVMRGYLDQLNEENGN